MQTDIDQDAGELESPGGPALYGSGPEVDRVQALEAALDEKDQLVAALTVQLEDVCTRLDRMQRTGSQGGVVSAGVPREMMEGQKAVLDELQEAVRRWEEMQAAAALGRIETQVAELRDLLVDGLRHGGLAGHGDDIEEDPADQPSEGGWDSMRAAMLGDEPHATHSGESSDESDAPSGEPFDGPDWVEPPGTVDLANASPELRQAMEERDEYIVWLIRRLRRAESPRHIVNGAGDGPEELSARLAELEHMFDEKLRLAEIELSIERARLAREDNRLRSLDEQMQKDSRRQGGAATSAAGSGRPADDRADPESAKSRRWRRMLGIGGDGE